MKPGRRPAGYRHSLSRRLHFPLSRIRIYALLWRVTLCVSGSPLARNTKVPSLPALRKPRAESLRWFRCSSSSWGERGYPGLADE